MISGSPEKKNSSDPFLSLTHLENLISHTFVAQQVEHPAVNREVEGSSPSMGANTDSSKETGTLSRCLGMALKTRRLSCYPKNGWLANLVKALG